MNKDDWYRKRIREMLVDFYKDVATEGFFKREETTTLKEFYEFLDKWIDKHFPYEMGEEEENGNRTSNYD